MRIGKIFGILALFALFATSALALSGSGASSSVTTNSSLTGNGTGGSPLGVTPLSAFAMPYYAGSTAATLTGTLNTYQIYSGFVMAAPTTWSHICVSIGTGDAVNKYDIGIVNAAGTLLADIGAQTLPSTGTQCFSIFPAASCTGAGAPSPFCTGVGTGTNPASVTTQPGIYRAVATGNAVTATAVIAQGSSTIGAQWGMSASLNSQGSTTNGILPASVAAITIAPTSSADIMLGLALY